MRYRHVQTSPMMYAIAALGAVGAVIGIIVLDDLGAGAWLFEAAMALVIAVGLTGARLTVTVVEDAVTATFGLRWPRRRVEVAEIVGVTSVHNAWWHGWGIRKVRGGWMYNNAGRDAVELALRSGRVVRIGTDEPAALLAVVERVTGA